MDTASNQWTYNNLEYTLHYAINNCKIENIKHKLSEFTESITKSESAKYLSEYNKNDIMF